MKHIKTNESFLKFKKALSLDTNYMDELAVNNSMGSILFNLKGNLKTTSGTHGGWTIGNGISSYTYRVQSFDRAKQLISLAIYDGDTTNQIGTISDINSDELKSIIINDIKKRFR